MIHHRQFTAPLLAIAMAIAATGCGEPETLTYTSGPVELTAAGPLFEGSNTAQGPWTTGLDDFLHQHGHTLGDLRAARLTQASIAGVDSTGLQGIRSVSVLWMGGHQGMQQMAVRNPLPADSSSARLTVANEQPKLAELLGQGTVTVVADLDLASDSDADKRVIGTFTLELTVEP
ncbi:MAG: hypothetical protein ACO1NQ_01875 [Flavobacteriales bacterium]